MYCKSLFQLKISAMEDEVKPAGKQQQVSQLHQAWHGYKQFEAFR
jgi:hypothetical protein